MNNTNRRNAFEFFHAGDNLFTTDNEWDLFHHIKQSDFVLFFMSLDKNMQQEFWNRYVNWLKRILVTDNIDEYLASMDVILLLGEQLLSFRQMIYNERDTVNKDFDNIFPYHLSSSASGKNPDGIFPDHYFVHRFFTYSDKENPPITFIWGLMDGFNQNTFLAYLGGQLSPIAPSCPILINP